MSSRGLELTKGHENYLLLSLSHSLLLSLSHSIPPRSHSMVLSDHNPLIERTKSFPLTPKNCLLDPPEFRALELSPERRAQPGRVAPAFQAYPACSTKILPAVSSRTSRQREPSRRQRNRRHAPSSHR
jgi:hypothetical protein